MKILLAIDSCHSQVVEYVTTRPWPSGTEFCSMSVVDLRHWEGLPELIDDAKSSADSVVKCATEKLTKCGYEAFSMTPVGYPKESIAAYAKKWGADLILVGSHGHGTVTRLLLGSVAQAVLRTAGCTVEIVRQPSTDREEGGGTRILVATDGSECSAKAVDFVANQLWPAHSQVRIVSVVELIPANVPSLGSQFSVPVPRLVDEICKRARIRAQEAITKARSVLTPTGLKISDAAPVGDARPLILDEANCWKADLIVLGSHGRHGLERLLAGSVAEGVAAYAHASVAIVR